MFSNSSRVKPTSLSNTTQKADDESSHSCHAILGRSSDQGKPSDHDTFHNKIHFTEETTGPWPLRILKKCPWSLCAAGVPLFDSARDFSPIGPSPPPSAFCQRCSCLPSMLTNTLGVFVYVVSLVGLPCIFMLRFHVTMTEAMASNSFAPMRR